MPTAKILMLAPSVCITAGESFFVSSVDRQTLQTRIMALQCQDPTARPLALGCIISRHAG